MATNETSLNGTVIGFEEYGRYVLRDDFGAESPFRILACREASLSFLIVNPFTVLDNYDYELDDVIIGKLHLSGNAIQHVATLCIARVEDSKLFVNFRSPLVINTDKGIFHQVILPNESYGVSVLISIDASEGGK